MLDHPSRQDLAALVFGDLPDDQAEKVALHVDQCLACEETVQELESATDEVIRLLRRPPEEHPFEQETECRQLVEVIDAIGREPSFAPAAVAVADRENLGEIRDYQLLAKLGQGGMGTVYKAVHEKLDKVVALKILPDERLQQAHAVERFQQEMKAVGRLSHPNIVAAYDAGEADGTHFLVMEYLDGVDLSTLVDRLGPLPVADACELICQAAIGLQHAHQHGLVHRDIKPSNLMLAVSDQPSAVSSVSPSPLAGEGRGEGVTASIKILDLGLARLHNGDRLNLTSTGQVMGTIDYMAPEQTGDSHDVDIRADIYSLGATLFKLLCGRAPYADQRYNTVLKKLKAMAVEPLPDIQTLRPDVPDELAEIVGKMLAKEPDERFATPAEVAAALAPSAASASLAALIARWQTLPGSEAVERDPPPSQSRVTEQYLSASLTDTKSRHSDDKADIAAARAEPSRRVSPKREDVSLAATELHTKPQPRATRWIIAATLLALLIGGGIWAAAILVRVRDKDGNVIAEVKVPQKGSVEIVPDPKTGSKDATDAEATKRPVMQLGPRGWKPGPADDVLPGLLYRPTRLPGIHRFQVETVKPRGYCINPSFSPNGKLFAVWDGENGVI